MELKKFIETTIAETIAFRDYWLEGHKREPEVYPMKLSEGEWFEQFIIYQETRH